jgi:DNA-binding Lrp family transcriptional regulator
MTSEEHKKGLPGIHLFGMVSNAIHIDVELNIESSELAFMNILTTEATKDRSEEAGELYFGLKQSMRQVGKRLNVSPTTVLKDINKYRKKVLKEIKQDLQVNKKVLNQMVGILTGFEYQIKLAWSKYGQLEEDMQTARASYQTTHSEDGLKLIMMLHDRQQGYMTIIRQLNLSILQTFKDFGLCGKEAMEIFVSGGIDVDIAVKQVHRHIEHVMKIIESEIPSKERQKVVFSRMAHIIQTLDAESSEWEL